MSEPKAVANAMGEFARRFSEEMAKALPGALSAQTIIAQRLAVLEEAARYQLPRGVVNGSVALRPGTAQRLGIRRP